MNNQSTSTRYENRFSLRIAKLIAAGALAASMVPTAAWAEENAEELPSHEGELSQVVDAADPAADEADASEPQPFEAEGAAVEEPASMDAEAAQAASAATSLADEPVAQSVANDAAVAQIGDVTYASLDEAVAAAANGDTITVLADCQTAGLNLSKDLTIEGSAGSDRPTITFTQYGIALWGKALTFKNCNVVMNGIGSTPYTAEWNWMTVCASKNASLSLDNATMTLDGADAGNTHAIYFCSNNKLNLTNGSNLTIKNYQQDALEWDGGDGGYNVNITDSTFVSDHNRSGFTGTFYATIDNSKVDVVNSLGNGSNGTYYTIKNNSNVLFDGNTNWGISAWRIDMSKGSSLTATNNGYSGIWTRVLNVDGTCKLDVEGNGNNAPEFNNNAGIVFQGNGTYTSTIDDGADVTIKNNAGSGIYTKQSVCTLTINAAAVITGNGTGLNNANGQVGATYGGGVYNVGTMVLGDNVVIYNNHASAAGDDIYSTRTDKSITFPKVGSDWRLDGDPDCIDLIDGWYDDSANTEEANNRWEAHQGIEGNHLVLTEAGTLTAAEGAPVALKAAHGVYGVSYVFISDTSGMELPDEVLALLPSDDDQYAPGVTVAALQPGQTSVKVDGGTWTFIGYDADEKTIEDDILFTGTWKYVADPADQEPTAPDGNQDSTDAPHPESSTDASDEKDAKEQSDAKELVKTGDDTLGLAASAAAVATGAALVALGARRFGRRH